MYKFVSYFSVGTNDEVLPSCARVRPLSKQLRHRKVLRASDVVALSKKVRYRFASLVKREHSLLILLLASFLQKINPLPRNFTRKKTLYAIKAVRSIAYKLVS